MPSQQINLQNFSNSDVPRSLTGPNILHKHSINSLLEQHDLITRGLTSPSEGDTMSISDILGLGNSTTNIFAAGQQQLHQQQQHQHHNHHQQHQQIRSNSPSLPYSPLTPNSTHSSISPGAYSMPSPKTFDAFQFDNIGQSTPLKMFQRNLSYDSSTPISPSTPSSLYPRSFKGSPKFRDSNSPITNDNPFIYNQLSSGSNSPDSDYNVLPNVDNNLIDLMNYLSINQNQQAQAYQQQQQQIGNLLTNDLQNLQTLTALKLLQQQQQQQQQHQQQQQQLQHQQQQQQQHQQHGQKQQLPFVGYSQILQSNQNQMKNWQQIQHNQIYNQNTNISTINDANLDRMARFHRSSAAVSDATSTWSGVLPQRTNYNKILNYSNKVFLGGIPPDVTEPMFVEIFKPFGQIKVEWPGKENQTTKPKGYAYIIFESEKQVKALLSSCSMQEGNATTTRKYFYKISLKCLKAQKIEVIPWIISDSNYVKSSSQKLDPSKTVFVGALHGQLTAEGLAKIMDELFGGVVYAGIDTDKHKYPLGSARVTFNNCHSYFKAVMAAFIDVRSSKFKRKIFQIDPYLEDSLCSTCGVQHGPYFCKELTCFRYFCQSCWQIQHATDATFRNHKPMSRNSKSQNLVGLGPPPPPTPSSTSSSSTQPIGSPTGYGGGGLPQSILGVNGSGGLCGGINGISSPTIGTPPLPSVSYTTTNSQTPLSPID